MLPEGIALGFPDEVGRKQRVPVPENVGPYIHGLARDPLHRETPIINGWIHVLDVDPLGSKIVYRQDCKVHIRAKGDAIPKQNTALR
jgi:hypothetical protein